MPPPAAPRGCWSWRSGLYFCFPLPPSHSLRTHAAGGGLGGQRIRPGISAGSWGPMWAGETWPYSLLILCPPNGPPISPFGRGIPSPPPATPQGASPVPPPLLLPFYFPPCLTSYPVAGGSSRPLRCPWPHRCLVGALVVRRHEFRVLLVHHLDPAPLIQHFEPLCFYLDFYLLFKEKVCFFRQFKEKTGDN